MWVEVFVVGRKANNRARQQGSTRRPPERQAQGNGRGRRSRTTAITPGKGRCQLHRPPHDKVLRFTLSALCEPGAVYELRIPRTAKGTVSGYFTKPDRLVVAALRWNGKAPGVYVTLNPVQPELLERAPNRVRVPVQEGGTTSDADIMRRRWLLVDFDPVRPPGASASAEEKEAAWDRCWECFHWLSAELGFPLDSLVIADSGNGWHLLVRIDLPNEAASNTLVKRCLDVVSLWFGDEIVKVDTTVGNAARICKIYGTMTAEGDDTPERPHRCSTLVFVPASVTIAPRDALERVAARLLQEPLWEGEEAGEQL